MAGQDKHVAEFQGLYGPFTVAERVLQKIWLQRDYAAGPLRLCDGRALEVVSPGEWNLLGGPDFRGALLRIDGELASGDVELHFHAADWRAHGHDTDPAYARVVLHVALFPPGASDLRANGALPLLALLPYLNRDLEDYAEDEALERLTARDEWRRFADLANRPAEECRQLLQRHAAMRWRRKVHYAAGRIGKLGWTAAAHTTALEILGYKHNRSPMADLAARHPLAEWGGGADVDSLYAAGRWRLHGVRPANHPRTRLRQYARWTAANPDWPDDLARQGAAWKGGVDAGDDTRRWRKTALAALAAGLERDLCGGAVGGSRLHTLVGDGFLPLLAARTAPDLMFPVWFHWYPGDLPERVPGVLRKIGVAGLPAQPLCQGFGQGLLGWLIESQGCA